MAPVPLKTLPHLALTSRRRSAAYGVGLHILFLILRKMPRTLDPLVAARPVVRPERRPLPLPRASVVVAVMLPALVAPRWQIPPPEVIDVPLQVLPLKFLVFDSPRKRRRPTGMLKQGSGHRSNARLLMTLSVIREPTARRVKSVRLKRLLKLIVKLVKHTVP